ncbi:MAG: DNA (cytosine-5-)-methyltransferase [Candidatus Thorarchaeota archaeon]
MTTLIEHLSQPVSADMSNYVYNHVCSSLSELDLEIVRSVPEGGNWKDIPAETVAKSSRLLQISRSGGRTTYYGRMRSDLPSYTINTYFNRPGNGTFIHPDEDRLITMREAARLQSFPDSYVFLGSHTSRYKQIGNAVPPILARIVGGLMRPGLAVDLFCGAGGLSEGLEKAGYTVLVASDLNRHMLETYSFNHPSTVAVRADVGRSDDYQHVLEEIEDALGGRTLTLLAGGPPCQGFSTAGNWSPSDERNTLAFRMLEVAESLTPDYVLVENVPGIRWMANGKYLSAIRDRLHEIEYKTTVLNMSSEEFGVPQRRRRVFVVGTRNGHEVPVPSGWFSKVSVSRARGTVRFESPELPRPVSVSEAISDLPELAGGLGDEVLEYRPRMALTPYQRMMRGLMSYEQFVKKRAEQG